MIGSGFGSSLDFIFCCDTSSVCWDERPSATVAGCPVSNGGSSLLSGVSLAICTGAGATGSGSITDRLAIPVTGTRHSKASSRPVTGEAGSQ